MPDIEKVIKGWECHMEADTLGCADCPYRQGWRTCNFADTLFKDVYAMLKEQEVKNVVNMTLSKDKFLIASCPKCNALLTRVEHKNYCGYCGQAVKWK